MAKLPPNVGPERTDYALTCGYTGDAGTDPLCGAPATTHLVKPGAEVLHGVLACDPHALIAQRVGFGREHPTAGSACCLPGSIWVDGPPSRCDLDGTGQRPELAKLVAQVRS